MERIEGIESVTTALEVIRKSIESSGGSFKIVMPVGSSCLLWFLDPSHFFILAEGGH